MTILNGSLIGVAFACLVPAVFAGDAGELPKIVDHDVPGVSGGGCAGVMASANLERLADAHRHPPVSTAPGNAARAAGKAAAARLMAEAGVPAELQAVFQAELMVEQDIPDMRAEGGPGAQTGRDASKDPRYVNGCWKYRHDGAERDADGSMNVGPWNDNVAMLSQYGGMLLPMRDRATGREMPPTRWTDSACDPQKVDWDLLERTYGSAVTDQALREILRYKSVLVCVLGTEAYMAGRRSGTSVIRRDGVGRFAVDPGRLDDAVTMWIGGQSRLSADLQKDPSKLTDGARYTIHYPWQ